MVWLFSSPDYAHFWVFSGVCVSLASSPCRRFSFCVALCIVSALNSRAIQSEDCISAANHECWTFFWKLRLNYFLIVFTENKMKRKRIVCAGEQPAARCIASVPSAGGTQQPAQHPASHHGLHGHPVESSQP